jgi:hypothetical protein
VSCSLALILLLATSSMLCVESASAQSITTPPIPEFTLKLVDYSYDVPATTTIDPYTGQQVANQAHTVLNKTIDVVVTNLDLAAYGESYIIIFNIQRKARLEQNWQEMYGSESGGYMQTTSKYTTVSFLACYPEHAQIDFQVKATLLTSDVSQSSGRFGWSYEYEEVGNSGWSNTKTVTIDNDAFEKPDGINMETVTPTSVEADTQSSNKLGWEEIVIAVMAVAIAALAVGLVLSRRKRV